MVYHMPTLNPRVNVTLSPSLNSLVSRLAGLERVSKSMVLRELLEAAQPALLHAVGLMEAAQGASGTARKRIAEDMIQTVKAAEGVSHLASRLAANNLRDLVSEAEEVQGRRPSRPTRVSGSAGTGNKPKTAPKRAKRPPLSNRGVKS